MVDRHDIDALLIGSLYGELGSADEARLKAHLESHPADRAALEGLTRTRDAVRSSRLFEVQLEPSQGVSALLMQEAARRAPRKAQGKDGEEGWFGRLRRSFLFSPAFAAAAMLVVVAGVAGTMYLREGDDFASPGVSAVASEETADRAASGSGFAAAPSAAAPSAAAPAADPAAVITPPPPAPASQQAPGTGNRDEAYRVDLAEGDARGVKTETVAAKPKGARPAALEVSTPQRLPKDLDAAPENARTARVRSQEAPEQEAARPADAVPEPKRSYAAAPKASAPEPAPEPAPPPAPAAAMAKESPRSAPMTPGAGVAGGAAATGSTADKAGKIVAADANLSWARDQHARLVTQVKAGRCREAAGTAVALSSREPGYYQQNVESDRDVKNCLAYINAELESTAERAQRARATTRRAADEPAKAAPPSKRTPAKAAPADPAPAATKRN